MKNILILVLSVITIIGCKKQELGEPLPSEEVVVEQKWRDTYDDGGLISGDVDDVVTLVGTEWELTYFIKGFAGGNLQVGDRDTILFVSNHDYTVNGQSNSLQIYTLNSVFGSNDYNLSISNYYRFGDTYSAYINETMILYGLMDKIEFTSDYNTNSLEIKATFRIIN